MLARLSAGIGLATAGLGTVFTVAVVGFGQIFTLIPLASVATPPGVPCLGTPSPGR